VKLLLDQNLSSRLVAECSRSFPDSQHVRTLGTERAIDSEAWDVAREHGYAIVSKDADFRDMAPRLGPPPKVIHLDVGNISTAGVAELLRANGQELPAFGGDGNALLVLSA